MFWFEELWDSVEIIQDGFKIKSKKGLFVVTSSQQLLYDASYCVHLKISLVGSEKRKDKTLDKAFSSNFGKRPLAKMWKKMIDLTLKLGEINDLEHNKGSK